MNTVVARGAELVQVRLLEFPVALHAAVEEHNEGLLREFSHISHTRTEGDTRIPERLVSLVERVRTQYSPFAGAVRDEIEQARRAGRSSIDLSYRVPASVSEVVDVLSEQFDEADRFCKQGQLLTLASPPEHVAFRRWFLGEFRRQVAGEAAMPWPVYRADWSDE